MIADVTADTDDNGAPFGILLCDLDAGRVAALAGIGGGGRGRFGGEGSCEFEGGLCLFFTFWSSFTFLFKLLKVVLNILFADADLTTDEEERTKG